MKTDLSNLWNSLHFLAAGLLANMVPSIRALAPLSTVKDTVSPMTTLTTLETPWISAVSKGH